RAVELIRARPPIIREAMAAALEDWTWRAGPIRDSRLRTIARQVDPDPWRNAIRDAEAANDLQALRQRTVDREVTHQPASTLNRLASALRQSGASDEAVELFRKAQRLHPHDFWIN